MRAIVLTIIFTAGAVAIAMLGRQSVGLAALAALAAALVATRPAHADADFVAVEQRNSTDTGWITRQLTSPSLGADGIMFFNGASKLPGYLVLGAGLTISSGVLASNVTGNVNADWTANSGPAQILNRPTLSTVATSGAYADLTGKPSIPAAQVNSDWSAGSGITQILNKPSLAAVATSGAYADLSGRPALAAVATSGAYADLSGKPTIPSGAFGSPTSRSVALATAYQCTTTTTPCFFTITLQSQSAVSLSGATNNEGAITIGSTNAVASGTGTNVAIYKNNLGGTLVVGLNLTSQQANTYTVAMPAGWYLAVRQTTGTGLQVVAAFDQSVN